MAAPAGAFAAAGVPGPRDPALSLLALIRVVHDTPEPGTDGAYVASLYAALDDGGRIELPLPLPEPMFASLVTRGGPGGLFGALVGSRAASLLYYGLMAMDAPTRAFLASEPALVASLARSAGAVAAFGRSLRVADGRVLLPGGGAAVPLWEHVVGARVSEPARFVERLFSAGGGRTAYMYDALALLPAPQQRYALGVWIADGDERRMRFEALHAAFDSIDGEWSVEDYPFTRPMHDPALLLRLVPADDTGAPPAWFRRELWDMALGGEDLPRNAGRAFRHALRGAPADAAWIARRVSGTPPNVRGSRFTAFAFGVRRAAGLEGATAAALVLATRAFARYPALMLALERMEIATLGTYETAARAAQRLDAIGDTARADAAVTQFQGALAILGRAARAGRISSDAAARLVASLCAVPIEDERYDGRIAAWLQETLLPALATPRSASSVEEALLAAMADRSPSSDGSPFEWEGLAYVVDYAAGDVARFRMVRDRQGAERIDDAIRRLREAGADRRARDGAARAFVATLAGLVYAPHQGDPSELFRAAAEMYLRHDLGMTKAGVPADVRKRLPWSRPRVLSSIGEQMRVTGALLGLDAALARFSVRRLVGDRMPAPPRLNMNDREVFFESAALMNPRPLTVEQMEGIAGALAKGRSRIAASDTAEALDALAEEAGVSAARRQLLSWTREDRAALFSLVEILRLGGGDAGALDAWGVTEEPLTGALRLDFPDGTPWEAFSGRPGAGQISARVPDLVLRLAEILVEIGAPAALLPGVLAYATQDFVDEAPSMHTDDWYALVQQARAFERLRVEDYIAAVAAHGPLRPEGR